MPNTSISGLVSGLDTATIISQLMQLEARPQTMLKSRVSTEQRAVSALQTFNAKLASIATKAGALAKATSWNVVKATSFSDKVLATADPGMSPTSLTMKVNSIATSATSAFATQATASGSAMAANLDYEIKNADGTVAAQFNTGDGTMQAVTDAINATGSFQATLVKVGVDSTDPNNPTPIYQLQVGSVATGAKSNFTVTQLNPADPANPVTFMGGSVGGQAGGDAEIVLNGQTLFYSENVISDLVPGLDVTLVPGAEGATGTINVSKDVASLTDSVKGMVDAVNAALDEIGTLTAYDAATKKGGLLSGDTTLRGVRDRLLESVTNGVAGANGIVSLAQVGIEVDRNGRLTFDEEKFKTAYAADPTATQTLIAGTDPASGTDTGFADKLAALGKTLSDSIDGTITLAIKSRQSSIKGMEDDIADWDVRLAARQTTLQRQYTALESALGKLQSQGNWLAGQIASLPKMSSGQ